MERTAGCALPDRFPSMPGAVFPARNLLAALGEFKGGRGISSRSSEPLKVDGLAVQLGEGLRLLLANFTGAPQSVVIGQVSGSGMLRMLDANSFGFACRQPEAFRAQPAAAIAAEPVGGLSI